MSEPILQIRGLVKGYDGRRVIDGLDFDLARGECLAILGRSGSGKSVTLRQLNGLEKPDAGSIRFEGVELTDLTERELFPYREKIGMLFQGGALFDSMTIFDNVAFPIREHTDSEPAEIAARVRDRLALVRLEGVEDKMPSELSGGMRKRVALARSLALDPEVMLYDEPSTGLDPMTSATIASLLRSTQRRLGVSSVVVTHDLPLTRAVADRLGFLDQGRFRFLGSWEEADRSDDSMLKSFLAGRQVDDDAA